MRGRIRYDLPFMKGLVTVCLVAVCTIGASQPVEAGLLASYTDVLSAGRDALADELYPTAEKFFKRALRKSKTDLERADAALGYAEALYGSGDHDGLDRLLDEEAETLKRAGHTNRLLYWRARHLAARQQYDAALESIHKASLPQPLYLNRLRADLLFRSGRRAASFALYRSIVDEVNEPDVRASILIEYAEALEDAGRLDEAAEAIDRLLEADPEEQPRPDLLLRKASIAQRQSEWDEALQYTARIEKRQDADPALRAEALLIKALALGSMTNVPLALAQLEEARSLTGSERVSHRIGALTGYYRWLTGAEQDGARLLKQSAVALPFDRFIASVHLQYADELFKQERYADALREYQAWLEAYAFEPDRPAALTGKAWSLWHLERYTEAAAIFRKAAEAARDPNRIQQNLAMTGDALFADGQYSSALSAYTNLTARYRMTPPAIRSRYQAALCHSHLEQYETAIEQLQAFEADHPDHALAGQAAMTAAHLLERQERWKEALALYQRIVDDYQDAPFLGQALHQRALLRYRLGFIDQALEDFDVLLEAYPDSEFAEHAAFMRGWAYYQLGQNEKALELNRQVMERYPESPWTEYVYFWMGEFHYNQSQYEEAEKAFARTADTFPRGALTDRSLYWAGRAACKQHRYREGLDYFSALLKAHPDSVLAPDTLFAQGDALTEEGRFAEAIVVFDELIRRAPEHSLAVHAWGRKGDCHFTLGSDEPARFDEAAACYRTVLDARNASPSLRMQAGYKIGRCEEKAGRTDSAFERYMEVVYAYTAEGPKSPPGAYVWFARAAFGAARLKESAGQWKDAVHIYERVVSADIPSSDEARKRIDTLRVEHWILF